MNIDHLPFSSFTFSNLFNSYINGDNSLKPFFETYPFDDAEVKKHLEAFSFTGERSEIVPWLKDFHSDFNTTRETEQSISKLATSDAAAVVTGQQCTIFGGPLFTIYKIITAIIQAKRWEERYERPFIPVFWIADEDHDFDEVAEIGIPANKKWRLFQYADRTGVGERVADIKFNDEIERVKRDLESSLFDTDFSEELWSLINSSYKSGNTFGNAFGQLILDLFGKHGLILAGSNSKKSKYLVADTMIHSISDHQSQYDALSSQTDKLTDAGFKNQVQLQTSNLFYIDDQKKRNKIHFDGKLWVVPNSDQKWTHKELTKAINDNPEDFSPNVFLRPIIQDKLLPVASYVAGPGETAYYAQMKSFYHQFDMKMPVIMPRFSATLIESGIERIIQKLPFSIPEYSGRIEDLEADYIKKTDSPDVEKIFGIWQSRVRAESKSSIEQVADIDPTLKKSAEKSLTAFFNELENLKGKVYKSLKDNEKTQLTRIDKIKLSLFPNRNLQERETAYIYFMNKYGVDLWDKLIAELNNEVPDSHKIIYL